MRRTLIALVCVALLSGCSTYNSANGGKRYADPSFCKGGTNGSAACAAMVVGAVIGVALLAGR